MKPAVAVWVTVQTPTGLATRGSELAPDDDNTQCDEERLHQLAGRLAVNALRKANHAGT